MSGVGQGNPGSRDAKDVLEHLPRRLVIDRNDDPARSDYREVTDDPLGAVRGEQHGVVTGPEARTFQLPRECKGPLGKLAIGNCPGLAASAERNNRGVITAGSETFNDVETGSHGQLIMIPVKVTLL